MEMPDLSILISTYQRPDHLYRCLLSLTVQERVEGRFEVVITDDGSTDETFALVEYFSDIANFPIKYTNHLHQGFQLSRCRNEGIAVSCAPYVLISDGDCVFPRDHVYWHLQFRHRGIVVAGDRYRLSKTQSDRVDEEIIRLGRVDELVGSQERKRVRWKALRGFIYSRMPLKMRPRLTGNNIAAWRDDLERVNGFDENFVGWGLEDRDLQRRLRMLGIRTRSILHRTAAYHLWHPAAPSFARNNIGTKNYEYYHQSSFAVRCHLGLAERLPTTQNLLRPSHRVNTQCPMKPPLRREASDSLLPHSVSKAA